MILLGVYLIKINTNPGLAMTLYLCEPNPNYGGTIIYDFKNKKTKEYLKLDLVVIMIMNLTITLPKEFLKFYIMKN